MLYFCLRIQQASPIMLPKVGMPEPFADPEICATLSVSVFGDYHISN